MNLASVFWRKDLRPVLREIIIGMFENFAGSCSLGYSDIFSCPVAQQAKVRTTVDVVG
jgi:hypothetical protein